METGIRKTTEQATSAVLWKESNAAAVALLKAGKFDLLAKSVSNKVSDLLECEPIAGVLKNVGESTVKTYLEVEIVKLAASVNVNQALNIKDHQVPVIADHLIENYKWESLEDFTLCFRRAAAGLYGEIYRLDGAVIGQWFSRYLDEKYDALEQKKAKEKHEDKLKRVASNPDHADKCIKQILENLGAKPEETDNSKENEYQRTKMNYVPPSLDTIKQKELHRQWIRENYDAISGKPLPNFISEDEWMNTKL